MQSMDVNATLIADDGLQYRCLIRDVNDKGFLVLTVYDDLKANSSMQLVIATPRIATRLRFTSIEPDGDVFVAEAISDEPAKKIRANLLLGKTLHMKR